MGGGLCVPQLPLQRGELGPGSPLSLSCGLSTEEEDPGQAQASPPPTEQ